MADTLNGWCVLSINKTGCHALSELALLVTAARWQSQGEWFINYPHRVGCRCPKAVATPFSEASGRHSMSRRCVIYESPRSYTRPSVSAKTFAAQPVQASSHGVVTQCLSDARLLALVRDDPERSVRDWRTDGIPFPEHMP